MTDDDVHWSSTLAGGVALLVAVLEEESVTRAARRLGMPQPTATRALARLQRDLGVTVVERVGRGLAVTDLGRAMLPHLRAAAASVGDARAAVVDLLDPEAGEVRLGFLHSLGPRDVPALVGSYHRAHPEVRFVLRQGPRDGVLTGVRDGTLDLGLVAPPPEGGDPDDPGSGDELAVAVLRSDTLVLVVPVGHHLAGRGRVDLAEASGEPFVLLTAGHGLRRTVEDLFAAAGIAPPVAFEGEDVDTLRGLVSAGLGLSILAPERAATGVTGVVELAVASPRAVRTVTAVWHRERVALPVARRFRDHVVAAGPALLARR